MELEWFKCKGNVWCELKKIDLNHKYLSGIKGVYVIWYGEKNRTVLRVGSGNIQTSLIGNRNDIAVMAFASKKVFVSWAEVSMLSRSNVHAYLAQKLNPKFKDDYPDKSPTEVNLPWDAKS